MFEKNMDFLTAEQAERIRGTTVAVVGAGALGQMTAHQLVRSGFEKLILIDKDVLEYSNFNRQLYALDSTVNQSKAEVLKAGLLDIWPQADIRVCETFLDECNGKALASGADLLMDCVDNADTKVCLEKLAAELKIPLVHGAVEGWYGQAATIFPGDALLERLYVNRKKQETAALMPTVCTIAALQVGEALKLAAGVGKPMRRGVLFVDMLSSDFSWVTM